MSLVSKKKIHICICRLHNETLKSLVTEYKQLTSITMIYIRKQFQLASNMLLFSIVNIQSFKIYNHPVILLTDNNSLTPGSDNIAI